MNRPFIYYGRMPYGGSLDELRKNAALWKQITARQTTPGSPHHDTEAIFLRWCADQSVAAAFTHISAVDYPAREALPKCSRLLMLLEKHVDVKELGRAMIVNLLPGGHIDAHIDEGAYADHYNARFHYVMESAPGNVFRCGNECVHMGEGELWRFDHKREHEVWNHSAGPRIHLIFDAVI